MQLTQQSGAPTPQAFLRHYFRLDARSLGLFRIAFATVLIKDLMERWHWVEEFYSNEGVLPNHNHLYNLRVSGQSVWSALHAFSTPGEAKFAFAAILFFYICFLIGFRTRAFHAMSVVSLVCLSARNTLIENWGNYLAIAVCFFTLFLPLGSRYGVDSLVKGMHIGFEADARELNVRSKATARDVDDHHAPGWSPLSIGAFAVLAQLALVYLSMAVMRAGSWKDGTALHDALHIVRIASPLGFGMRNSGVLGLLTHFVRFSEWAIIGLLFLPVVRGPARLCASAMMIVHGLIFALLFNFGLFGWTLAASGLLVVSTETWDRFVTKADPKKALTVIYDADCGICFWLARLLKRLDTRKLLTFQGNDSVFPSPEEAEKQTAEEEGNYRDAPARDPVLWRVDRKTGEIKDAELPKSIKRKLLDKTVVAVGPSGEVYTEARAVHHVLAAIPGALAAGVIVGLLGIGPVLIGFSFFSGGTHFNDYVYDLVGLVILAIGAAMVVGGVVLVLTRLGVTGVATGFYRWVAERRTRISVAFGLAACGTAKKSGSHLEDSIAEPIAPSTALSHRITGSVRELLALVLFASMLVQTSHENNLPFKLGAHSTLESIAWYSRMLGQWDVLTPVPPSDNSRMVVDAVTKDDVKVDTLTGTTPYVAFDRPFELGQLWSDWLYKVQDQQKYQLYQQWWRPYITKAGPRWVAPDPQDKAAAGKTLLGVDVYWMTLPPGANESDPSAVIQKRLFRTGRGGATLAEPPPPMPPSLPPGMGTPAHGPLAPNNLPNVIRPNEEKRE